MESEIGMTEQESWEWRTRWYEAVFALVRARVLPRECATPSPDSPSHTKRLLGERLGRTIESLREMEGEDWKEAALALERHFGMRKGETREC